MRPFGLTTPCADCPFRTDIRAYLRKSRVEKLEADLREHTFSCHKTVDYDAEADEDGYRSSSTAGGTAHCAGALILLEKIDRPSRMMLLGERLGIYDKDKLNMRAPVFDTFAAMRKAQDS